MTTIILILLSVSSVFAAKKPKFHCYTVPNSYVGAYQTPIKCQGSNKMEIVCMYQAVCKPVTAPGEPPKLDEYELKVKHASGELKSSQLICKGKAEVVNGTINPTSVVCPPPTQCLSDGLYAGVASGGNAWIDAVTVPEKGAPRVTR